MFSTESKFKGTVRRDLFVGFGIFAILYSIFKANRQITVNLFLALDPVPLMHFIQQYFISVGYYC